MPRNGDVNVGKIEIVMHPSGQTIVVASPGRRLAMRGKAVEFVLALITATPGSSVLRDELHRLHGWKMMSSGSVGKQAARITDKINAHLGPVIEWGMKTGSWRFKPVVHASIPEGIRDQARTALARNDWAGMLRFDTVPAQSVARWMQLCGSALADMTEGKATVGYQKLRQASELSDHEGITAIGDVLATRIGQALPRAHLPVPSASSSSAFLEAAEARRMAAYARLSPSSDWQRQFDLLHRRLLRMIQTGDTATQANLFNALAVLARRMGQMDKALDCIREAAALAIFSGDIVLIQNISFNFGNIITGIARNNSVPFPPEIYLGLLQLDIELRERLHIGKDSAQAELLCAYLAHERGRYDETQVFLTKADAIIEQSCQPLDLALRDRIRGLLGCDTNAAGSPAFLEGLKALRCSIEAYRSHGNLVAAQEVEQDVFARSGIPAT